MMCISLSVTFSYFPYLLWVPDLNFLIQNSLIPLANTVHFFLLTVCDPLWHLWNHTDQVVFLTGLWEEDVFLLERNQTTAGAQVSGNLHWSDPNPGHDSHHYSALGSVLRQKRAWDRPNDVSAEWDFPAPVMPLSAAVETEPVQNLRAYVHGKQL